MFHKCVVPSILLTINSLFSGNGNGPGNGNGNSHSCQKHNEPSHGQSHNHNNHNERHKNVVMKIIEILPQRGPHSGQVQRIPSRKPIIPCNHGRRVPIIVEEPIRRGPIREPSYPGGRPKPIPLRKGVPPKPACHGGQQEPIPPCRRTTPKPACHGRPSCNRG